MSGCNWKEPSREKPDRCCLAWGRRRRDRRWGRRGVRQGHGRREEEEEEAAVPAVEHRCQCVLALNLWCQSLTEVTEFFICCLNIIILRISPTTTGFSSCSVWVLNLQLCTTVRVCVVLQSVCVCVSMVINTSCWVLTHSEPSQLMCSVTDCVTVGLMCCAVVFLLRWRPVHSTSLWWFCRRNNCHF